MFSAEVAGRHDRKRHRRRVARRHRAGSDDVTDDVITSVGSRDDDGGECGGEGGAMCGVQTADHREVSTAGAGQQLARGLSAMFVLRLPSG